MIVYIENAKESAKIIPAEMEFSKVGRYQINIQKPIILLCTRNDPMNIQTRNKTPLTIAQIN